MMSSTPFSSGVPNSIDECTVVKRNGTLVPFRKDRIERAIEAAFRATRDIPVSEPLPKEIHLAVRVVAEAVVVAAFEKAKEGACLSVEGIQDLVEEKLLENGHYDVGRRYIIYRDERKIQREDSPRNLKLFRRDGKTLVRFKPLKIASAIERAFRASLKIEGSTPQDVVHAVNMLTSRVVNRALQLSKEGVSLHVELIQDEIERQMMAEGYYQIAKDFIIYRTTRALLREKAGSPLTVAKIERKTVPLEVAAEEPGRTFEAKARDGSTFSFSERELRTRLAFACRGFEEKTSSEEILEDSIRNFYDGIKVEEIDASNIMAAKARIEKEPDYAYVSARILLDMIYRETLSTDAHSPNLVEAHKKYFKNYLKKGIELERLDPQLLEFDLDSLANALKLERDQKFTYLGLQTLYDRYLIHHEETRLETPQIF